MILAKNQKIRGGGGRVYKPGTSYKGQSNSGKASTPHWPAGIYTVSNIIERRGTMSAKYNIEGKKPKRERNS